MFTALYSSSQSTPRHPPDVIPTEPKISQLQVIETVEQHLRSQVPNLERVRLYFFLYNFTDSRYSSDPEYANYIDRIAVGGWQFSHVKENPELLNLPLFFVHANGTQYQINSTDGTYQVRCLKAPDINNCAFPKYAEYALKDRLVYRTESIWYPPAVVSSSYSTTEGYHAVDAETGELVWNTIDSQQNRLPSPRVDIYSNASNAMTIRERMEAKLNPQETTEVQIVAGASNAEQMRNFVPQEGRGVMEISNKVRWTNYDAVAHTVTSDNDYSNEVGDRFDSGIIEPSDSYEFVFSEVGEFQYHCDFHPWMRGMIEIVPNFA